MTLSAMMLGVCVKRPGYLFEAFTICMGIYVIHKSWHMRFEHWRGAIFIGVVICLIGIVDWLSGSTMQDLIDGNQRLREIRDEILETQR
jgi:hypothetical protein